MRLQVYSIIFLNWCKLFCLLVMRWFIKCDGGSDDYEKSVTVSYVDHHPESSLCINVHYLNLLSLSSLESQVSTSSLLMKWFHSCNNLSISSGSVHCSSSSSTFSIVFNDNKDSSLQPSSSTYHNECLSNSDLSF